MKRIAVYSTAGGVGKSFIAASLASSLFQRGVTVVLCELSSLCLLPIHFGAGLQTEAETGDATNGEKQKIHTCSLHQDFTLLTPNTSVPSTPAELLVATVRQANKLHGVNGVIILDIPTNIQFKHNSPLFNIGLEVVSADPVSIATVCNSSIFSQARNTEHRIANEHYMVVNKKDLRSTLSNDSAIIVENLFGKQLLGNIHYDSTVPEAFSHKSLVGDYAPQSRAAADINELAGRIENLIRPQNDTIKDLA